MPGTSPFTFRPTTTTGATVAIPVLYMQDGQNLFDAERAYIPGQHWKLKEAADTAIGERTASPMIIVAVDHAGTGRMDEYTPVQDEKHRAEPRG